MSEKTAFEGVWRALEKVADASLIGIKTSIWAYEEILVAVGRDKYRCICCELTNRVHPPVLAIEIAGMIKNPVENEHFLWLSDFQFVLVVDDRESSITNQDREEMEAELNTSGCPWVYLSALEARPNSLKDAFK